MKNIANIFKNSGIRSLTENQDSILRKMLHFWITPKNIFFTETNTICLAYAIGAYLHQKHTQNCNILLGYDTRTSGPWIKKTIIKSINKLGHHVFDAGIIPTPFIAQTIKNHTSPDTGLPFFQLGIIITASHNQAEYNGIKIITPDGYLTIKEELQISELFFNIHKNQTDFLTSNNFISLSPIPNDRSIHFNCISGYNVNIKKYLLFQKTMPHMKLLLDCANGATSHIAKEIFQQFYPNIVTINDDGNGALINADSGCSIPTLLIKAIQKHNAQWGCAFDGDGDRIIIANKNGEIFDGDDILIVLSQHPKLAQETTFVGTIMSNNAIEQYFQSHHKTFLRTDVGERNIIQTLQQHQTQLGSEACGHITVMNHAYCSDGIFAALLFLEIISSNPQALQHLPKKFPQVCANIPLHSLSMNNVEIEHLVLTTNKAIYPGRIIARTSNTEPVFRLTVEHPNVEIAHQTINKIKQSIIKPI